MNGYTHAAAGAAAGLALAVTLHAPALPVLAGGVAGALAVDLDYPTSWATSYVPGASLAHRVAGEAIPHRGPWHSVLPGVGVALGLGAVAAALPYLWPLLAMALLAGGIIAWHAAHTRHALACWSEDTDPGNPHHMLAYVLSRVGPLVVLLALGAAAPGWFAAAVGAGWLSHLVLDGLTPEGVAPLWPLPWRVHGPISTGGALEGAALVVLVAAAVLLLRAATGVLVP